MKEGDIIYLGVSHVHQKCTKNGKQYKSKRKYWKVFCKKAVRIRGYLVLRTFTFWTDPISALVYKTKIQRLKKLKEEDKV